LLINAVLKRKVMMAERLVRALKEQDSQFDLNSVAVPEQPSQKKGKAMATAAAVFPWPSWRLIHIAAWLDDAEMVRFLVAQNVDVEARTSRQQTPLHVAALKSAENSTAALIQAGANVSAQNPRRFNQTPLHVAAIKGATTVAERLLAAGARPNAVTGNVRGP
jgi:ankyrin repeat protein